MKTEIINKIKAEMQNSLSKEQMKKLDIVLNTILVQER